MSDKRSALLRAFIESDASPSGKWWIDVPVGLSIAEKDTYESVDAICMTSRSQELPEEYPEHTGVAYVVHEGDTDAGVTKVDSFQSVRDSDIFSEETVTIVSVESGKSHLSTVGKLLAYRTLLQNDWDWEIDNMILVSDFDDSIVNFVCAKLGIRAVRVVPD